MAAKMQMTFSKVFSSIKIFVFWYKFPWKFSPVCRGLIMNHHWFRSWLTSVHGFDKKSSLVQLMACCHIRDKWMPDPMITQFIGAYACHSDSVCLGEGAGEVAFAGRHKGLRPDLEGFVITMHEGACETGRQIPRPTGQGKGFDVLFAQARVHCNNKPRQIGINSKTQKNIYINRARRFPLLDGPGQLKLPVGQVDFNRFFFFISYKQIEELQNTWSQASDKFEKRQALKNI